jgi:hypothetical protein
MFHGNEVEERPKRGEGRGKRGAIPLRRQESGAKATALQTLRDHRTSPGRAKRLDCGAFTAAFASHLGKTEERRGKGEDGKQFPFL